MRIIPEWRKAWRFSTTWAIGAAWFAPDLLRVLIDYAPQDSDTHLLRWCLIGIGVARMIYQPKVRSDGPTPEQQPEKLP